MEINDYESDSEKAVSEKQERVADHRPDDRGSGSEAAPHTLVNPGETLTLESADGDDTQTKLNETLDTSNFHLFTHDRLKNSPKSILGTCLQIKWDDIDHGDNLIYGNGEIQSYDTCSQTWKCMFDGGVCSEWNIDEMKIQILNRACIWDDRTIKQTYHTQNNETFTKHNIYLLLVASIHRSPTLLRRAIFNETVRGSFKV